MIVITTDDGDEFQVENLEAAKEEILQIHATGTSINSVVDPDTGKSYSCTWNVTLEEEDQEELTTEQLEEIGRRLRKGP